MQNESMLVSLLPLIIICIPLAIGNYILAGRLGRNQILWAILSLIPLFNYAFFFYVFYVVTIRVLDYLDGISKKVGA